MCRGAALKKKKKKERKKEKKERKKKEKKSQLSATPVPESGTPEITKAQDDILL